MGQSIAEATGSLATVESSSPSDSSIPSLSELLEGDPDRFVAKYTDIGAVNLACARGLAKCDETEFPKYLALLDTIAEGVKRYTEKNWRLFKIKPQMFGNSENVFRCLTMEHVFRVQFHIKYDPMVRAITSKGEPWNTDDSTELFIHGLLSSKRTGTCSSLPTFAIAVGRRLGYPLKLILVPNHTLYRWDDGKEVFNLQPSDVGGEVKEDEYFHGWPRKWDDADREVQARTKVWLHSMTPKKEVSKFLCNRALILRDVKRYDEAFKAIAAAIRFDPINPACGPIQRDIQYHAGASLPGFMNRPWYGLQDSSGIVAPALSQRVEPTGDQLLDALYPFRDRARGPKNIHVQITRLVDDAPERKLPTMRIEMDPKHGKEK